jgi:hypothetical protein
MRNPFKSASAENAVEPAPEVIQSVSVEDDTSEKNEKKPQGVAVSEAIADLDKIAHAHQFDPNLPQATVEKLHKALEDGDAEEILEADALFTDDSPYTEVRLQYNRSCVRVPY